MRRSREERAHYRADPTYLGLSLSEQARAWTRDHSAVGKRK